MSELHCENIGGLIGKHSFVFQKGINVLNAPNSSGKTSIINAIKLSCAGDWENENLEPLLNNKSDYGMVEFKFNGYRQKVSLTRDKGEVRFLSRELDFKFKRTKTLCFLMKDSPLQIAINKADNQEIKRWFYDITDLDYYEIARGRAEGIFRQYQQQKEKLENKLKGSIYELNKLKNEYVQEKENLEKERDSLLKSPELEDIEDKIDELDNKIKSIEEILKNLDFQLSNLQLKLTNSEKELYQKENDLDEEKKEFEVIKRQILIGEEKILELEENYNSNQEEIMNFKKEINGYDEIVEDKTIHIEGIKEIIRRNKDDLNEKISIEGLDICPKCGTELNPKETEKKIKALEQKIEEIEKLLRNKEAELNEFLKAQKKLKGQINEITKELPEMKNEIDNKINTINSEIKGYKGAISSFNKRIKELEKEIEGKNKDKKLLNDELQELISPYKEVKETLKELNIKIEEITKKINDVDAKIKFFEEGTEEIKIIRRKVDIAEYIVRHFSNRISRIKQLMLEKLINSLKECFELLELAQLDRISITEKFDIIITRKGGYETSIAELSGAERALIAFIIMVIAKNEFLPEFPILIIDEIGEFMDKTRFLKIIDYLKATIDILIITRNKPLKGKPTLITQTEILHDPIKVL